LRAYELRLVHPAGKRFCELVRREIDMGADLSRSPGTVQ
jgi:hypothetical protein